MIDTHRALDKARYWVLRTRTAAIWWLLVRAAGRVQMAGDKEIEEHPVAQKDQERKVEEGNGLLCPKHGARVHIVKIVIPIRHGHHLHSRHTASHAPSRVSTL